MKKILLTTAIMLMGASAPVFADNNWSNYRGVDTSKQHRPPPPPHGGYPNQQRPPVYPNQPRPPVYPYPPRPPVYPNHPRPPVHPYPPQNGISIHYTAPSTVQYSSNSYSWVNGEASSSSISSSTYVVVSDWQRLGLPAPPQGMYWIMENGRYILVPK